MSLDQLLLFFTPVLEAALGKYGFLVQVVTVIGSLRLVMKPLTELVRAYVMITPSTNDNAALAKVEASKGYKIFLSLLNYFASIKLPQ